MRRLAAELGIQAPSLYKHVTDKGDIEGLLQHQALIEFGAAVRSAGDEPRAVAAAYRSWALANPHLYELAARRPLRRDLVGDAEAYAATPIIRVVGGNTDLARAFLGLAHGLVDLELNKRFPPEADIDAAWEAAIEAIVPPRPRAKRRRT